MTAILLMRLWVSNLGWLVLKLSLPGIVLAGAVHVANHLRPESTVAPLTCVTVDGAMLPAAEQSKPCDPAQSRCGR